jgi:peptide/nickel transport system permease protein
VGQVAIPSSGVAADAIIQTLARERRAHRRWQRATLWSGIAIILVLVLVVVLRPVLGLPGPNALSLGDVLQSPSTAHLFGTDDVGRDILSRSIAGLGVDLRVGVEVTAMAMGIGVAMGAIAGFVGGPVEALVMRLADVVLAFPFLVLVIAIIAAFGPGLTGVYIGIPAAGWAIYARFTRAEMLAIRERDFMSAARTLGFPRRRIFLRHALPNVVQSSLVYSTIDVVLNIMLLASLSYLGLGVQPPSAELGSIISDGQQYLRTAWWIAVMPGALLVLLGAGFSLIGDGLAARLGYDVSWGK